MATINGTDENNELNGTSDDDIIITGLGDDTVDGGDGTDQLEVDYATVTDSISYSSTSVPAEGSGEIEVLGPNSVNFTNIEAFNLTGTQFDDELFGGNSADTLRGSRGNDVIDGGQGEDVLDGGGGFDTLRRDLSDLNEGSEVDNTGQVTNLIDGTVARNFENLDVVLGSGNDTISTGLGEDIVDGGEGTDQLVVDYATSERGITYADNSVPAEGSGQINASFNPSNVSFSNIEVFNLTGSQFDDELFGGNSADTLRGSRGNDFVNGGNGRDVLDGGAGADTLRRDLSEFNQGSEIDNTGRVTNLIDDTVARNFENLDLVLGSGNDTIKTGLGEDIIDGGAGTDRLEIDYGSAESGIVYDGNSVPEEGSGQINSSFDPTNVSFSNIELFNLAGSQFDDELFGGNLNDTLRGAKGDDSLEGGSKNDILAGGDDDDLLIGAGEDDGVGSIDTLTGGSGADTFVLGNADVGFYNDDNGSNAGLRDYALIRDFDASQDFLQLAGSSDRYLLRSSPIEGVSGSAIYSDTNENGTFNSRDELIAVLEDSTELNLTADYAVYV
jgi:Ca2+-binding RTX toxin-like protein